MERSRRLTLATRRENGRVQESAQVGKYRSRSVVYPNPCRKSNQLFPAAAFKLSGHHITLGVVRRDRYIFLALLGVHERHFVFFVRHQVRCSLLENHAQKLVPARAEAKPARP